MSNKIREEVIRDAVIRAVQKACTDDDPKSLRVTDGEFVLTLDESVKRHWKLILRYMSPPSGSTVSVSEHRWPSYADRVFGNDGILAGLMEGYESRTAQLQAARMVQRGIEMGIPAVIEAGTGIGKSLMYLMIARAMGKKVLISTSNKALQQQLYKKDSPFVASVFPSKIALAQGKQNYVCNHKALGAAIDSIDFNRWLSSTEDGDLESLTFQTDWQDIKAVQVDDNCVGLKNCPLAHTCFYHAAKVRQGSADIIITNHMLLALHEKYPFYGILPDVDVIVVDEAHNLAQYAQNALGIEFSINGIARKLTEIENHGEIAPDSSDFLNEIRNYKKDPSGRYEEKEIGINANDELGFGIQFAVELDVAADMIWRPEDTPELPSEIKAQRLANSVHGLAANVRSISQPTVKGFVRWIGERERMYVKPYDVSEFVGRIAGFHRSEEHRIDYTSCARCNRALTAKRVHILHGKPFGPTCISYVDHLGEADIIPLAEWLGFDHEKKESIGKYHKPIIFTSATIAAPNMDHFMREHGLEYALTMQAESPFDYSKSQIYIPNGKSPSPKNDDFYWWSQDQMIDLINATGGGAFCLFTSIRAMTNANDRIRSRIPFKVYMQGELPKMEIIARMKNDKNSVLFATKSFFEGVDIQGNALRLVIIDKIPFAAMTPFNNARSEAAKRNGINPFKAISIPEAIIDLKQGAGRLIRSSTDVGMVAILDNRLNAPWARGIVEALPNFERISDIPESKKIGEMTPAEQWIVFQ